MANVAHATLTGADLHEPKGIGAASALTVYVADGVGSGAWTSGSALVGITGQVAFFANPFPPTGWLECDGSNISRTTFATLFSAVTIQQSGVRTNGSAIITGLSNTANMRAGYFVGALVGTQITNGSTILSVDSANQITMSTNALSSGTATVVVSPWALGDGLTTITLPDTLTQGRYLRARSNVTFKIGNALADSTKVFSHTHTQTGTFVSTTDSVDHNHTYGGNTGTDSVDHTHAISPAAAQLQNIPQGTLGNVLQGSQGGAAGTGGVSVFHTHAYSGTTSGINQNHTHSITLSGQTGAPSTAGDTETRPISLVLLCCVKT